jgi:lipopolysaccharide transport system permease protein
VSTGDRQLPKSISATEGLIGMVRSFVTTIIRNRGLLTEMVMRDLKSGFVGHGFGMAWVYIQPLVVVLTFMLIFGVVIGSKMAVTGTFPGDYISYILAGLVPWLIMANALNRGPSLFASHANLVKQVVFPVEILPVAAVVACFMIFIPCLALLLFYKIIWGGGLSPMVLLLPVVLVMHMVLSLGLILILSVITPFIRDIREFVGIYLVVAMYFTPAIYLPDWVPAAIRPVLYLNPFSYVVWVYQDVMFFGRIDHGFAWIVFALMTAASFVGGLLVFRKIKPFLGNVL